MKSHVTYNGLADQQEIKADLNKWVDHLKESINCDTGHLSDRACTIINYTTLLKDTASELFAIFEKQKADNIKEEETV